jgi:hypothetical protein
MEPKARFVFVLAVVTWAMAEPSPSIYPIYQSQLPLLY